MKNYFRLSLISLLAGVLLLSACKSAGTPVNTGAQPQSGNSGSTTTSIDACALLTKVDAEAILGKPVKDAEHPIEGSAEFIVTSCQYSAQSDSSRDITYVIASVPYNGDMQAAKTSYDTGVSQSQSAYGVPSVNVPGLGDAAYWVAGSGNLLTIRKGDVNLNLKVSTYTGDTPPQPVIHLAKVILGRLP